MNTLSKIVIALVFATAIGGALTNARAEDKVVHIGFQKYGKLVLLKSKATLEGKLKALGYTVAWTEFPSGPPLLEAINAGAIDFGNTGESPPIFAQAAGIPFVYVAYEPPAPKGEAILVPKDSTLKTVADLKGKKVAFNKGANVHYLVVKALEKAGVKYSEIEPVFLAPADAPRRPSNAARSTPGRSGIRSRPPPKWPPARVNLPTAPGSWRTRSSIWAPGNSSKPTRKSWMSCWRNCAKSIAGQRATSARLRPSSARPSAFRLPSWRSL